LKKKGGRTTEEKRAKSFPGKKRGEVGGKNIPDSQGERASFSEKKKAKRKDRQKRPPKEKDH